MSTRSLHIHIKINFPVILIMVMALHALAILMKGHYEWTVTKSEPRNTAPLKIRDIRTVGSRESHNKSSTYLSKNDLPSKTISKERVAERPAPSNNNVALPSKRSLSFSDLAVKQTPPKVVTKTEPTPTRPGTRPEVVPQKKALNAISLKGSQIQKFVQASDAVSLSGERRMPGLSNSDILVNLEVPEGVNPDELNEYELMFYGFQRRTAINYINSFYKNLDKFQRENPHLQFPMTETKQVMTGRLTYDEKGNIKQIKMIRWSNVDKLQDFFVDVLKDMDTLHNPPHALWEKTGEFTIFFSLVVNG